MEISAEMVKKLREMTGAGVMECKTALSEANGDFEKAIEILRKRGAAVAQKKASRTTKEGIVTAYVHFNDKIGVLLELGCETDFVARMPEFKELAYNLAKQVAAMRPRYVSREDVPQVFVCDGHLHFVLKVRHRTQSPNYRSDVLVLGVIYE